MVDEALVRAIFAAAVVSFDYDAWPLNMSTLEDTRPLPSPSYVDPRPASPLLAAAIPLNVLRLDFLSWSCEDPS